MEKQKSVPATESAGMQTPDARRLREHQGLTDEKADASVVGGGSVLSSDSHGDEQGNGVTCDR